jgi:hypothetical protein
MGNEAFLENVALVFGEDEGGEGNGFHFILHL